MMVKTSSTSDEWGSLGWTPLAAKYAPFVVGLAIRSANRNRPLFYGEVVAAIESRFKHRVSPIWIGHPAGLIARRIELLRETSGRRIPPLNVIISNKASGVAGDGGDEFIRSYLGMSEAAFRQEDVPELRRRVRDDVYDYGAENWAWVAAQLKAPTLPAPKAREGDEPTPIELPPIPTGSRPEGDQHKRLKAYVAQHPVLVKSLGKFPEGTNEVLIRSGDRLDVLFELGKRKLAVEVKPASASEAEMARGVFQCVKYRAVLRAQQLAASEPAQADAILAIMVEPTHTLRRLMHRLEVQWLVVTPAELDQAGDA